jgi:cytochrome c oxidase subunit I+III
VRSVPIIQGRYPLWDQPDLMREVNTGRFYLPDAEEGRREGLVTSVLDAEPLQCIRVYGKAYVTIVAAAALGGVFIALTFHWWIPALVCGVVTLGAILYWLWTGTAEIPEKPRKDVGLGLSLPLYASGPASVGWWAMFITMIGDGTAFGSLVFGYFFYWTIHDDYTAGLAGPCAFWPTAALALFAVAWALLVAARELNSRGGVLAMRACLLLSLVATVAASLAGFLGPWSHAMDPTAHVYPAIVWTLVIWTLAHAAVAVIMQLYCLARSLAGRLTREYDADIRNVALYGHFLLVTAAATFVIVGWFPLAL